MEREVPARVAGGDSKPSPIEHMVITTEDVVSRDRFEWWRSEFCALHKVEIASDRVAFSGRGEHWRIGPMLIGRYQTAARRVIRTPDDIRRDDLDHWLLRILIRGTVEASGPNANLRAFPGQVTVSSFAQSYSDTYTSGEWIAVMIARDVLPTLDVALRNGEPTLLVGVRASLLTDYVASLISRLPAASPSDLPALIDTTAGMVVACMASADLSAAMVRSERPAVMREIVDRLIRKNFSSTRLDSKRLCALAGLSRSTLYRLFEDRGGVAEHIRSLRLERIRSDLCDPRLGGHSIASIAASRGLHNTAAFNRAFRRAYGCTPGDVRAAALRADAHLNDARPQTSERRFVELLVRAQGVRD